MIRNILFDLDGTIIDSYPGIQAAFNGAYEEVYGTACPHDIRTLVGPPIRDIFAKITGEVDPVKVGAFAAHFQGRYDSGHYQKSELYVGMVELLEQLKNKGLSLYIATNKRIIPTRLILDHLNIRHYFKKIYSSDSITPAYKSKVEMVAAILEEEELEASQTILAGDTHHDELAARENGMDFVYADYGFGELEKSGKTVSTALEILKYI